MGAATAGLSTATFGAMDLDENNKAYENERLKVRRDALRLHKEGSQVAQLTALQAEILAVVRKTGDPSIGGDWPTEIIAPPEEIALLFEL
jgi:hypothetical protein